MGLPCWAFGAEPEDLLGTSQSSVMGKIIPLGIASMVPLCQGSFALRVLPLSKCWVLDLLLAAVSASSLGAAWLFSAHPLVGCLTPLVATGITEPANPLVAVCHHTVRCTIICFKVPLTCQQGINGGQGVMLADLAANALRAPTAFAPFTDG